MYMSLHPLTTDELQAVRAALYRDLRKDLLDEVQTLVAQRPNAPPPDYLRPEEACRFMQISSSTLYKLRKTGLPSIRVEGLLYLRVSDINNFLASQQVVNA